MTIEVNKVGTKDYYDEMLYVVSYYRDFINNPNKKIKKFTSFLATYGIISLILMGIATFLYLNERSVTYAIILGIFAFLLVFIILYSFMINNRIKEFMKDTSTKIINIEKDYVEFKKPELDFKMEKEKLAMILIGKNSICFLPKEATNLLISISTEYKDEVLKGLKENGYEYNGMKI